MAAHDRGKNHPLNDWLYAEGPSFDFFQAVKLLELTHPPEFSVGGGGEPGREAVRFKSSVRLDFPADDIASVEPPACPQKFPECQAPVMRVNFMGLTGGHGPLPKPVTELILSRLWHKDRALRDFLDIFNHRLVSLLYRIRKLHRFGLDVSPPGDDRIAGYVYALLGLGTPALRDLIHDRPLLFYAGLLGQQPRSMVGLERILSDQFRVGVEGEQFKGGWLRLEPSQWTLIGTSGQNNRLGEGPVLGTRVWDQQLGFELKLGPLTLEEFMDFLPVGWNFGPLCELVRFYVGDELDFSFRLILKAGEAREAKLSAKDGARLGWTSWLGSGGAGGEDSQVSVSPASWANAFPDEMNVPTFGLPPDKFQALLDKTKTSVRKFKMGEKVVRQGEEGHSMFVIISGSLRVTRREEDGKEVTLKTLRVGDIFGEMSLLAGRKRNATVEALEDGELRELSKKDLEEFIEQHPRARVRLHAFAQRRTRKGRRKA